MVFINLMETHLPYTPPENFVRRFAPIVGADPEARRFIETYNTKAFHWLLPLEQPLPALEIETLNQMYDAEIAYQDHLLHELFQTLDQPYHRENTMVLLVGDHGEMLGEHLIMGHALGTYQELIHVPLIIRYPGQEGPRRVGPTVSATWLFHTILHEVGLENIELGYAPPIQSKASSLKYVHKSRPVLSESYAPNNMLLTMEKLTPQLVDPFNSRATHRSYISDPYKLLQIDGVEGQLFNLQADPFEGQDLSKIDPNFAEIEGELLDLLEKAIARRPANLRQSTVELSSDQVTRRLRGLGYLD
jgi:uncharacterized sulfatase